MSARSCAGRTLTIAGLGAMTATSARSSVTGSTNATTLMTIAGTTRTIHNLFVSHNDYIENIFLYKKILI